MSRPVLVYYEMLGYQPQTLEALERHFEVVKLQDPSSDTDDVLRRASVILAPLGHPVDAAKMDRCPSLAMIASATLVVPHIDLDAARARNVEVCWLGGETELIQSLSPTAELTWGLVLAVTRRIPSAHAAAIDGVWGGRPFGRRTPRMLSRMSLGVVGLGRLGRMVARYGAAFGMPVYYYSPRSTDASYQAVPTLLDLARSADIVSVHVTHTPDTDRLIDRAFIRAMRPGSFLINTSRGGLIDEAALLEALRDGHLAGAGLDALADEYEPGFATRLPDHPLVRYAREHDNLIITPHYGGATVDAWQRIETRIVERIVDACMPAGSRRS